MKIKVKSGDTVQDSILKIEAFLSIIPAAQTHFKAEEITLKQGQH
jgi:hypothetical protein